MFDFRNHFFFGGFVFFVFSEGPFIEGVSTWGFQRSMGNFSSPTNKKAMNRNEFVLQRSFGFRAKGSRWFPPVRCK